MNCATYHVEDPAVREVARIEGFPAESRSKFVVLIDPSTREPVRTITLVIPFLIGEWAEDSTSGGV